ncbi:MAG: type II secretion system GspH family protein [Planctomycetota bacterium]|nr:type II secretion system GspH family protein [Planctomycetota bacterium]
MRRAFTLIEILVVVAIIALLSTLTANHIFVGDSLAKRKIALAKCKEYHDAFYARRALTHDRIEFLEDLSEPIEPGGRRFIRITPDPWAGEFRLVRDGRIWRVWCNGPDGEEGTTDDICYEPVEEPGR